MLHSCTLIQIVIQIVKVENFFLAFSLSSFFFDCILRRIRRLKKIHSNDNIDNFKIRVPYPWQTTRAVVSRSKMRNNAIVSARMAWEMRAFSVFLHSVYSIGVHGRILWGIKKDIANTFISHPAGKGGMGLSLPIQSWFEFELSRLHFLIDSPFSLDHAYFEYIFFLRAFKKQFWQRKSVNVTLLREEKRMIDLSTCRRSIITIYNSRSWKHIYFTISLYYEVTFQTTIIINNRSWVNRSVIQLQIKWNNSNLQSDKPNIPVEYLNQLNLNR